jgi:hypothetical protein
MILLLEYTTLMSSTSTWVLLVSPVISLLIGCLTVLASYKIMSKQIRKNKSVQWIDDFRSSSIDFLAFVTGLSHPTKNRQDLLELNKLSLRVQLLVNQSNPASMEFYSVISSIGLLYTREPGENEDVNEKYNMLTGRALALIREIIEKEENNI